MRRALVLLSLSAALAAAGCGSSKKEGPTKGDTTSSTSTASVTTTTTTAAAPVDAAGCTKVAAPRPKGPQHLTRPTRALPVGKTFTVTLQTNCGAIVIRLDTKRAPKTSASFASLVKKGFYDGLTFHRIVQGFVVQGGDPLGNGQGGPGYTIVEKPPRSLQYVRGVVAMAKSSVDPSGASGSQFFIVTANAGLPPQYALLGRVTSGMNAVDKMTAEPVNPQSAPFDPVVIQKATLSG
jgi:peptidyl-prolyl cis-trans isomerase B (cyclophilin B)